MTFVTFHKRKIEYLLNFIDDLKIKRFLLPLILSIGIRILFGVWLFLIVYSVTPELNYGIFYYAMIWGISWLVAYFVIFLPGGIGLREGILTTFLVSTGIGVANAMLISILTRVHSVVLDGLLGLVFIKERN